MNRALTPTNARVPPNEILALAYRRWPRFRITQYRSQDALDS
jgi:hypothetical protein